MGITVFWCPSDYYCRQLDKKSDVESTVLAKAPPEATQAKIRCGWHKSWSDKNNHVTVNYMINEQWRAAHIRRIGLLVWGDEISDP